MQIPCRLPTGRQPASPPAPLLARMVERLLRVPGDSRVKR